MRLEPTAADQEITSESDFFQRVKKRTTGVIGWERIEPANESGFPDTYFVIKSPKCKQREGTVEFKFWDDKSAPQLNSDLTRGTQKAALFEYQKMGGNRRFFLAYALNGDVWLYNTADAAESILTGHNKATSLAKLEEPAFVHWLMSCLER
jgi:hypothetical protein